MIEEIKDLYKKDKKLAIQTAKALGYKIKVKSLVEQGELDKEDIKKKQKIHRPLFEISTYLENAKKAAKFGDVDAMYKDIDLKKVKDNATWISSAAKRLANNIK